MKRNIKNIESKKEDVLSDDEQQSEEANREIQCHTDFSKESVESQNSNQGAINVIIKQSKNVHIGPKFECHNQTATTSEPNKFDLLKNPIFVKCKEKLKNQYITNFQYMRSFFWEGKRNDLPIKNHFVELVVQKSNLFGKKEREKINLEEIFSKKIEDHQTILITGESGYGKTTLCKKIAYDWAADEISFTYLDHFDLAIVILLRDIGGKSIYELILNNTFQNAEEVKSKIETENLNILVMLDGFDEISNKSPVLKFIREESFDISLRMTILVTSRTEATEGIREDMKSRFSVEGFSEQQQQKYIQLMFRDYEDKGKELFEMLKEKESFSEIRKCPLILHMICCLYLYDGQCLKEGITDLYIRMISLLIKRYRNKNDCNYIFKKGKYFYGEDLLIRLGKSLRGIITDLKKVFPIKEEYNFIAGLGILEFYRFSAFDEDCHFNFVHSSFYEFIKSFTIYFSDYSDLYQYMTRNVLLFMMGLSGEEPFPEKVQDYFKVRYRECSPVYLYRPYFMLQVYREIKTKTNWELFCSLSHLVFSYEELNYVKELLSLYNFTQMHFVFPENKSTYDKYRDILIDFYKNYNINDKLVIFLYVSLGFYDIYYNVYPTDKRLRDAKINYRREVMSCVIDFFNKIGPIKHKIYFSGLAFFADILYFFRNIEYLTEISKNKKEDLNSDENGEYVALQLLDNCKNEIDNYIISAEQYELLRDRIKIFPLSEGKHPFRIS